LNHLAVATNDGKVTIRKVENLKEYSARDGAHVMVNLDHVVHTMADSKEWLEELRYSPDGKILACGSHDNYIYLYHTNESGAYKKYATSRGHSSYIHCLDWSADSQMFRTVCGAYELLFWSATDGKQITGGASATVSTMWADQHCKFGWRVDGIYPPGTDGTHVNSCSKT
jgi:WD40 repeat protein